MVILLLDHYFCEYLRNFSEQWVYLKLEDLIKRDLNVSVYDTLHDRFQYSETGHAQQGTKVIIIPPLFLNSADLWIRQPAPKERGRLSRDGH